ncbi:MAG: ATP-binding cassette domain-containing protein, partial [Candidatus Dormibacteria bacterium]
MTVASRARVATRGVLDLVVTLVSASPPAAIALGVIALLNGLLLPVFVVASGNLVAQVRGHGSVLWPLTVVCVVFVVQRVLEPVSEETAALLALRVDNMLARRVMRSTATPPGIEHLEDPNIADLLVQGSGDPHDVTPGRAAMFLVLVISQAVQGLGALVVVGLYSWPFALLLMTAYAGWFALSRKHYGEVTLIMNRRTRSLRTAYYVRSTALGSAAAKEARVFALSPWLVERYRTVWLSVMRAVWDRRREGWLMVVGLVVGLGAVEIVVMIRLASDALAGAIGLGTAVAVTQAVIAAGVAAQFTDGHAGLGDALNALSAVRELEVRLPDTAPAPSAAPRDDMRHRPLEAIRFEHVRFQYPGAAEPVFTGLDLEIPVGRSLAIVGGNGAGKTTIVKLLARLCDPSGGRITVDGVDLCSLPAAQWQRRVAAVFQDYVEYELSAFDNVAFGCLEVSDDRAAVVGAAVEAGAERAIARLKGAWDTPLTHDLSGGTQLSGGEW